MGNMLLISSPVAGIQIFLAVTEVCSMRYCSVGDDTENVNQKAQYSCSVSNLTVNILASHVRYILWQTV